MHTSLEHEDFLYDDACGCEQCGTHAGTFDVDEDLYDDPYEVVMYDIDAGDDDLYALFDLLDDSARSWYAKRRLNALAASGPLSTLVAAVIIDSLGRRWDPLLHPRDRFGRFIETGGFIRWLMKGVNLRGQVSRIDSDGNIHVRSVGNDSIPDGASVRFKPAQASKLISIADPVASLSEGRELPSIDLNAEIPDFPEASATQRRIYNALQGGDMPAADLDVYRSPDDGDLTGADFASEITGLEERGLIEIDNSGDRPRVRRSDNDDLGVVDIGDDEIDDIPDDETPDLEDSPAFTKEQRDLLDRLVEADRGEGDGVGRDELEDVDDTDLQALIDAGALEENEDGRLFLENPEGADQPDASSESESDISQKIFEASQGVSDDPDVQEAFQHFAEELARPGDEANIPLPEGLAPAKRRNADAAARKWWAEQDDTFVDEVALDEREEQNALDEGPDPKEVLNPRNQAMADQLLAEYFPEDEFLDSNIGVEYRGALKRMFDAEDLQENGFDVQADAERDKALRAMRRIEVPEEDIEGWPAEVQDRRNADQGGAAPDDVTPEPAENVAEEPPLVLPGDEFDVSDVTEAPEEALPEEEVLPEPAEEPTPSWNDFSERLNEEGPASDFFERLSQENRIADELGLDLHGVDAPWSWENLAEGIGFRPAELLFNDSNGSLGVALAKDPDPFVRQYENELLAKFEKNPETFGPEVMRLRQAGLIEATEDGGGWRLTEAGRQRLGIVDGLPAEETSSDVDDDTLDALNRLALGEDKAWNADQKDKAAEVFAAMKQAQLGHISRDDAYEVAAGAVREGILTQQDLENIQDAAMQDLGDDWDYELAIDYVGDDQRDIDAPKNDQDRINEEVRQNLIRQAQEPDVPEAEAAVPSKPASEHPKHQAIIGQKPFVVDDFRFVTKDGNGVLDRNGRLVELGGWYKANRGGEGDPNEIVGFYDQDRFPGWLLGRSPDGKYKAVHVQGRGREGGLNRIAAESLGREIADWGAQRRARGGLDVDELDQFKAANRMNDGVPAEVGMAVEYRGGGKKIRQGEVGIVARVGMDKDGNVKVYVLLPGAQNERELAEIRVNMLRQRADTPAPSTPTPAPEPNAPNFDPNNLPEREWQIPLDNDIIEQVRGAGPVDLVDYANAHIRPGEVFDQVQDLIGAGRLEIVPDSGNGRVMFRVPEADSGDNVDLPRGALNAFEGSVLNAVDDAGDVGIRRADLVDIEDDDAGDKLLALRELVQRGVLREVEDPDGGRPLYRRPTVSGNAPTAMNDEEAAEALKNGADPFMIVNPKLQSALRSAGYNFQRNYSAGVSENNWAISPDPAPFPVTLKSLGEQSGHVYMIKQSSYDISDDVMNEVMASALSNSLADSLGRDTPGLMYHPKVSFAEFPHSVGAGAGGAVIMDHAAYGFPEGHQLFSGVDLTSGDLQRGGASHDIIGLGLYDYIINNTRDRHRNNQMYVKDPDTGQYRVVIIDNGFGFGAAGDKDLPFRRYVRRGRPNALLLRADLRDRTEVEQAVQDFVSTYQQIDVNVIMDRIRALFPTMTARQEAYAREWLETAKTRVDDLAVDISDVVDTLMTL